MSDNLDGDNDDDQLSTNDSTVLLARDDVLTNESTALTHVPALVPVPHLLVTNSPLRDSSLQSLDPVPVYDLDSSLHSLSSSLILHHQPMASNLSQPLSDISVTTHRTEFSDLLDPSDSVDICETSPKPSEAIDDAFDDEYDYVTVDSSVHPLPSSFETLPAT